MITEGEAWLLLRKWKEESTLVRVVFTTNPLSLDFEGRFMKVSDTAVSLDVGQDAQAIQIGWPMYSFEYGEPEPASKVVPDNRGRVYSACLSGKTQDGQRIYLFKIKEETHDG